MQSSKLMDGARNLLNNCAEIDVQDRLLIICEDPALGWYDEAAPAAVLTAAREIGLSPLRLSVGAPGNSPPEDATEAISAHDCIVYFARIGDQGRFGVAEPGQRRVMSYARTGPALASRYGRTNHKALLALKIAINDILLNASTIEITCPLGTKLSGKPLQQDGRAPEDVSIMRFPLSVPVPIPAEQFSGRIAVARYLTPTGSRVYEPAWLKIEKPVLAEIKSGRIVNFEGDRPSAAAIRRHHRRVAQQFSIDDDRIHSWHAGIHPGCYCDTTADEDPDLWSNTVFGNPRILHFHTCGDYAPGEICWLLVDATVCIDGKALWHKGRLCTETFSRTNECVANWPELGLLLDEPYGAIGLSETTVG